jgi:hypothetical protein
VSRTNFLELWTKQKTTPEISGVVYIRNGVSLRGRFSDRGNPQGVVKIRGVPTPMFALARNDNFSR